MQKASFKRAHIITAVHFAVAKLRETEQKEIAGEKVRIPNNHTVEILTALFVSDNPRFDTKRFHDAIQAEWKTAEDGPNEGLPN